MQHTNDNQNAITIKVGTNVLACTNGMLDTQRMESLVAEIAQLHRQGYKIILVSSGSVAAGRSTVKNYADLEPVAQRQLLSSVGQIKLIDQYKRMFDRYDIPIGQILVTKQDFGTREHYLNMKYCIGTLWNNGVVPIVNENDATSVTALMFTDNDELSGLMASMMDCSKLFILSNVDGIYNGDPKAEGTQVVREIRDGQNFLQYVSTTKSNFGRGGMQTKCRIAQKTASSGIDVYIANGTTPNVITRLVEQDPTLPRTHFEAGKHSPAVKKWLAYSDGFAKAAVVVNDGAKRALLDHDKAASLLAPGVTLFEGDFEKNDLILVKDENGHAIGVGRAGMDKDKAIRAAADQHTKPLVHYDYLYIYPTNI